MAKLLTVLCLLLLPGCVFGLFKSGEGYDTRLVAIQSVSLFNQRTSSRLEDRSWKGDWVFRRDRLNLIDEELKSTKPDLLLLQEMVEKTGSPSESDQAILGAGSLSDHEWRSVPVKEFSDTYETQKMGVAVGLALKLREPLEDERSYWMLGNDGFLQVVETEVDGEELVVFNVQMPSVTDNRFLWYAFVKKRIVERLEVLGSCRKRVVVGGFLPGDMGARRFSEFVNSLELVDSSTGFCQLASNCYTATPTNDIYMATVGDASPTRPDRIFLHKSAIIYTSNRIFNQPDTNNRYVKQFGISRNWPTQRYGWSVSARFSKCSAADKAGPMDVAPDL